MNRPEVLVDRGDELSTLDSAWSSPRPSLILVYGRRRVGKTFLIRGWARLRGVSLVYLVVNYSEEVLALRDLEKQLRPLVSGRR